MANNAGAAGQLTVLRNTQGNHDERRVACK